MKRRRRSKGGLWVGAGLFAAALSGAGGWWLAASTPTTMQGVAPARVASETATDEFLSGAVIMAVSEEGEVRDFPSISGGSVAGLQAVGTLVTGRWVRGADANSRWLRLANGGYVHSSMLRANVAKQAPDETRASDPGSPIALSISNTNCEWGNDIAPYIQIAIDERRRQVTGSATVPENESTFARIPARSWRGLTLTAVAVHYESSSLYFREPVAEVIAVLRAAGITVDANGAIPITNEEAVENQSIGAPRGDGARYGSSEISCGV
jgi:hypothetical protein